MAVLKHEGVRPIDFKRTSPSAMRLAPALLLRRLAASVAEGSSTDAFPSEVRFFLLNDDLVCHIGRDGDAFTNTPSPTWPSYDCDEAA